MTELSNAERDKFAAYLEEIAASDDALAVQCDQLLERAVAKRLRTEAMAAKIVAAKLRATEFQTVTIETQTPPLRADSK